MVAECRIVVKSLSASFVHLRDLVRLHNSRQVVFKRRLSGQCQWRLDSGHSLQLASRLQDTAQTVGFSSAIGTALGVRSLDDGCSNNSCSPNLPGHYAGTLGLAPARDCTRA